MNHEQKGIKQRSCEVAKGHIVQDTQTYHVAEKGRSQFSATEGFKSTGTVTC
jgi:hypothetical protein